MRVNESNRKKADQEDEVANNIVKKEARAKNQNDSNMQKLKEKIDL